MGGLATEPLPSQGSPIEGDKFRRGYITSAILGADSLVRGGGGGKNRHGWEMVKKDARHTNTPPGGGSIQMLTIAVFCPHGVRTTASAGALHISHAQTSMTLLNLTSAMGNASCTPQG